MSGMEWKQVKDQEAEYAAEMIISAKESGALEL